MDSKYANLLDKYNAVLSEKPNDSYTISILARIAMKENRFEDAENYYNLVLKNDSEYPEALYMMGFISMKNRQYSEALNYFRKLISIGKANSFVYEYAAVLDKENRREYLEKALELSKEIKTRAKDYKRCSYMAFQTFIWKEYNLSLEYANLAYTAKQTNDIINLLGCIYHHNEDYDKALSLFHEVNANYEGNNSYVLCNIASCYRKKNSNKMAIRYLEKARDVDSEDKLIYYNIGSVYAITGNKKLAAENFEKALEIDENYDEARRALDSVKE